MPPVHRPTEAALKTRARTMLEQMGERARWLYAVPRDEAATLAPSALEAAGFARAPKDDDGEAISRWIDAGKTAEVILSVRPDLEVTLVEAAGEGAAGALAALLDETGFYAQSTLLASAYEPGTDDARKALATLAPMIASWDAEWAELFELHLASDDPVARHDTISALCIAAMVADDPRPIEQVLAAAAERESSPKVREVIEQAKKLLAAVSAQRKPGKAR